MNIISFFEKFKINKAFFGILILFTTICALNIPILNTLWRHSFDDGTYSHAFLIPFISLYLYYTLAQSGKLQFRDTLSATPATLLLFSCYLLFVTSNAQISIGYWGASLAILITSVTMLYRFNWYIVFPTAFLVFVFPFWGVLVPLLQNISVVAVTYMMSFTGVPTYVEAEIITIPAGVFEIAGGCSGLRYMIVSLAIGSLFIFLNIKDTKKAALFLSLTILGALLTNWIRITALILIGEYTNMESSLMDDHNTFGWYLYVPFMILLFWWGNKLSDIDSTNATEKVEVNAIVGTAQSSPNKVLLTSILFVIGFSSTTLNSMFNDPTITHHNDKPVHVIPSINFYSSLERHTSEDITDEAIELSYNFDGSDLDGKPTYYDNKIIPEGWRVQSQESNDQWQIYLVTNGHQSALVKVSYEIDGKKMSNKRQFKMARLINGAININQTKLYWSFTPCSTNCKEALQNL